MFGVELTAGGLAAFTLYFLGCGMMAWACSMRGVKSSRAFRFAFVALWPLVAVLGTIIFLFPSLDYTTADADAKAKRDSDERRGPPPPAFGGGA